MISNAQVSELKAQPSPTFPKTRGRTPKGSLTPISLVRVMATIENAPSTRLKASSIRSGMFCCKLRAIKCIMHSLSDED